MKRCGCVSVQFQQLMNEGRLCQYQTREALFVSVILLIIMRDQSDFLSSLSGSRLNCYVVPTASIAVIIVALMK